jgi:two-component system cell cycle response regulator PopA
MSNRPTDLSYDSKTRLNRRVLIIADNIDESVELIEHLRALGLDVLLTDYAGEIGSLVLPNQAPSAVLCFLSDYIEHAPQIVAKLRERFAPRDFPIIGRLTREATEDTPFDSVLYAPVHGVQVAYRIFSLIRLGQMEAEIIRRQETLKETFGQTLKLPESSLRQPFRVLFIGKADPAYMAVVNALQDKNVNVVAAFTSFSAFDYLHDGAFDAVVMNALSGTEPAMTIAETMRRNPRLFHVPTLLLVDKATFRRADVAFAHGIKDLIDAKAPLSELSGRILELANDCRLQKRLKDEFLNIGGDACSDPETGVLNERFLTAHLKRVSRDCRKRQVPMSVLTIKLIPKLKLALDKSLLKAAFSQCVRDIANMVRMQDIVARLDDDTVVVAFPEERRQDVARIAARIKEMIETSTFPETGTGPEALRMMIETAIVEQAENPDQSASKMSVTTASLSA